MSAHLTTTETRESARDCHPAGARNTPRLIRFLRADMPALDLAEVNLGRHSTWTVGRVDESPSPTRVVDPGCIVCHGDALMSAAHACLEWIDGAWTISDLGSKNGTFVNHERITRARRLEEGDIIEFGNSFFIYRENDTWGRVFAGKPSGSCVALTIPPQVYQVAEVLPWADSNVPIHLHAETGAGKEVVASAIHELSGRPGAFVAINCAAIPENLFETELFGYVRGAFSGANANKKGHIVDAQGGTLFLDEVGELSPAMQAKLLRVLELREVLPVGATVPTKVNFRLVSATMRDLSEMVDAGRFRQDLFGRLGHCFSVPPLREHKEYIGKLMPSLLAVALDADRIPLGIVSFSVAAARAIVRHAWPYNIREFKQCIDGAVTAARSDSPSLASGLRIEVRHLPARVALGRTAPSEPPPCTKDGAGETDSRSRWRRTPDDAEIARALESVAGNRAEAARLLGVSERTVFRRLRKLRESS